MLSISRQLLDAISNSSSNSNSNSTSSNLDMVSAQVAPTRGFAPKISPSHIQPAKSALRAAEPDLQVQLDQALSNSDHVVSSIRAGKPIRQYGLLVTALKVIDALANELDDIRHLKHQGLRERFNPPALETLTLNALETRYRINGIEDLKRAADQIRHLRRCINHTYHHPTRAMKTLIEAHAQADLSIEDDDDDIPPLLLKLVRQKRFVEAASHTKPAKRRSGALH